MIKILEKQDVTVLYNLVATACAHLSKVLWGTGSFTGGKQSATTLPYTSIVGFQFPLCMQFNGSNISHSRSLLFFFTGLLYNTLFCHLSVSWLLMEYTPQSTCFKFFLPPYCTSKFSSLIPYCQHALCADLYLGWEAAIHSIFLIMGGPGQFQFWIIFHVPHKPIPPQESFQNPLVPWSMSGNTVNASPLSFHIWHANTNFLFPC